MYLNLKLVFIGCLMLLINTIQSSPVNLPETADANTDILLSRQAAGPTSYSSDAEFIKAMLRGHNFFRSQHGAAPVTWNAKQAAVAATYSKACVFRHSGTKGVGENIAYGFPSVAGVVNAWGEERMKYDFSRPGFSSTVGHFTAIVWKGTTQIGCGRTRCTNGMGWNVICQYTPPGNVIGAKSFGDNVGRQIRGNAADKWNGV